MATSSVARDFVSDYSISEAISVGKSRGMFGNVSFYFGTQKHGKVNKNFGSFSSNKKTNAFGKSDKEACQWAFLSSLKTFVSRANREGGNAVINIKSNYKNHLTSSNETFQCGAGSIIAGVSLVGDVVKIAK